MIFLRKTALFSEDKLEEMCIQVLIMDVDKACDYG